ncbi:MAG TPA: hypothetical protein VGV61_04005 [Thermoanaerobaculia bacterium]|jgi:dienelactone hydrolase|nr:hypothetical protein [Thermoanaerobaculia bacterium]
MSPSPPPLHRSRLAALLLAAILAPLAVPVAARAAGPPSSPLWAGLEPGPYAVGFQVLERRDPARPFRYPFDLDGRRRSGDLARPLQIGVWYPAQATGAAAPMWLGDYVALMGAETDFTRAAAERARRGEAAYFAFEALRGATAAQRQRLLALPTAAVRDAKPAAGPFPVVLWSLGSPALYQASAEHLASHGYVVAIVPRLPPTLGPVDTSPTRADYDAKSRDLDFLLAELGRLPFADVGNVGVTGFSAGGRWAIAEAMRNPSVRAVVSQDSVLLFGDDQGQLAAMPFYDPERVRVPALHMIRRQWVPRETADLWTAMRYAERTRLIFEAPALQHLDFASMGHAATLAGLRAAERETVAATFRAWQTATLWFLDAALKGDANARAHLADLPASLGLAKGLVTAERTGAAAAPLDEQQLSEALVDDFAAALPRVRQLLAARGGTPATERALNLAGYGLLGSGRAADGLALFVLNRETFPTSANALDSLADGYEATGKTAEAVAASRQALELLAADSAMPAPRRDAIRQSAEGRIARLAAAKTP